MWNKSKPSRVTSHLSILLSLNILTVPWQLGRELRTRSSLPIEVIHRPSTVLLESCYAELKGHTHFILGFKLYASHGRYRLMNPTFLNWVSYLDRTATWKLFLESCFNSMYYIWKLILSLSDCSRHLEIVTKAVDGTTWPNAFMKVSDCVLKIHQSQLWITPLHSTATVVRSTSLLSPWDHETFIEESDVVWPDVVQSIVDISAREHADCSVFGTGLNCVD